MDHHKAFHLIGNWTDALDEERAVALRLAQRAAAISRDDPMVLAILGAAHGEHLERALSLDPISAWAWGRSGWLNIHLARPEVAIQQFERAIRLSPFDPAGFVCFFGIADACSLKGQYDETIEWSHKGLSQQPEAAWHLRVPLPPTWWNGSLTVCGRQALRSDRLGARRLQPAIGSTFVHPRRPSNGCRGVPPLAPRLTSISTVPGRKGQCRSRARRD